MKPRSCVVVTQPIVEPVSLSEVRAQLRLASDQTEESEFLLGAVAAARRLIERRLGISLVATQYRATWPAGAKLLELPNPPVLLNDDYGITVTVDGLAADFSIDTDLVPAEITLVSEARESAVVTYWTGVAPGGQISPQLRSALLLYVGHLFNNREASSTEAPREVPMAFETLLASESVYGGW